MDARAASPRPRFQDPLGPHQCHGRLPADESPAPGKQNLLQFELDHNRLLVDVAPTIYLIDDDLRVLKALRHLLASCDYTVLSYDEPKKFLKEHDPYVHGCVISDLSMPGCDGIALQAAMNARGGHQPIIFLTGFGTIAESVRAMKGGAVEFLTKPVDEDALLEAVRTALKRDLITRDSRLRLELLTERELAILRLIVAGHLNKQIGVMFGITDRTVKFHRSNFMRKLKISTTIELIRLASGDPRLNDGA